MNIVRGSSPRIHPLLSSLKTTELSISNFVFILWTRKPNLISTWNKG